VKTIKILFIGYLSLCISCKNSTVEPEIKDSLIPLAAGNEWIFQETTTGIYLPYPDVDTVSFLISESKIISNQKWYRKKIIDKGIPFDLDNIWSMEYQNASTGILSRVIYYDSASSVYLYHKYPTSINDKNGIPRSTIYNGKLIIDTFMVSITISVDTVITVPAGTYHCVHHQIVPSTGKITSKTDVYISPNYGWIKEESVEYFNGYISKKIIGEAISIKLK